MVVYNAAGGALVNLGLWISTVYQSTHLGCSSIQRFNGPAHEVLVFIGYAQKPPLNARTGVYIEAYFLFEPYFFHTMCIRKAKALTRLHVYTGSCEHSLLIDAISTKTSCAGANVMEALYFHPPSH